MGDQQTESKLKQKNVLSKIIEGLVRGNIRNTKYKLVNITIQIRPARIADYKKINHYFKRQEV